MSDEPKAEAGRPLLTPAQHLAMAELIVKLAGQPGAPTIARARQMARNHRVVAAVAAAIRAPARGRA